MSVNFEFVREVSREEVSGKFEVRCLAREASSGEEISWFQRFPTEPTYPQLMSAVQKYLEDLNAQETLLRTNWTEKFQQDLATAMGGNAPYEGLKALLRSLGVHTIRVNNSFDIPI